LSKTVIHVEGLSKAYQLGEIGTGTLSRDLERWFARVRGKQDPFLTLDQGDHRNGGGGVDTIWSLRDV